MDATLNYYAYSYYLAKSTVVAPRGTDISYQSSFDYSTNIPTWATNIGTYSSAYGTTYHNWNQDAYDYYNPVSDYQTKPAYQASYNYVDNTPYWADGSQPTFSSFGIPYYTDTTQILSTSTGTDYSALTQQITDGSGVAPLIEGGIGLLGALLLFHAIKHVKNLVSRS